MIKSRTADAITDRPKMTITIPPVARNFSNLLLDYSLVILGRVAIKTPASHSFRG